jgi:hypothetical protein
MSQTIFLWRKIASWSLKQIEFPSHLYKALPYFRTCVLSHQPCESVSPFALRASVIKFKELDVHRCISDVRKDVDVMAPISGALTGSHRGRLVCHVYQGETRVRDAHVQSVPKSNADNQADTSVCSVYDYESVIGCLLKPCVAYGALTDSDACRAAVLSQ